MYVNAQSEFIQGDSIHKNTTDMSKWDSKKMFKYPQEGSQIRQIRNKEQTESRK